MNVNLQTPGHIQVELNPGESFIAKGSSLSSSGSEIQHIAATMAFSERAKSILAGEPFSPPVMYRNGGSSPRSLSFRYGSHPAPMGMAPPVPTKIVPVKLTDLPGPLVCERRTFFAASEGVELLFWEHPIRWFSVFGLGRPYKRMLKGNGVLFMEVPQSHIVEDEVFNAGAGGKYNPAELLWFSTTNSNFGPAPAFSTLIDRIRNPSFEVNGPAKVTRFRVTTPTTVFDMGYFGMLALFWTTVFWLLGHIF